MSQSAEFVSVRAARKSANPSAGLIPCQRAGVALRPRGTASRLGAANTQRCLPVGTTCGVCRRRLRIFGRLG